MILARAEHNAWKLQPNGTFKINSDSGEESLAARGELKTISRNTLIITRLLSFHQHRMWKLISGHYIQSRRLFSSIYWLLRIFLRPLCDFNFWLRVNVMSEKLCNLWTGLYLGVNNRKIDITRLCVHCCTFLILKFNHIWVSSNIMRAFNILNRLVKGFSEYYFGLEMFSAWKILIINEISLITLMFLQDGNDYKWRTHVNGLFLFCFLISN